MTSDPRRPPPPKCDYPESLRRAAKDREHTDVCAWCERDLPGGRPAAELSDGRFLCRACSDEVPR